MNKFTVLMTGNSIPLKVLMIAVMGYSGISFNTVSENNQSKERWSAPVWADTLINPLTEDDADILAEGEELFTLYCALCHGESGYGDGAAGGALGEKPANFHDSLVTNQSDGALFWKISTGKGNMPPFTEAFTEEQRWQLVSYLRKLADN